MGVHKIVSGWIEIVQKLSNIISILGDLVREPIENILVSIDTEHYEIHDGSHFMLESYFADVPAGGVNRIVFKTGSKLAHMVFEIYAADGSAKLLV